MSSRVKADAVQRGALRQQFGEFPGFRRHRQRQQARENSSDPFELKGIVVNEDKAVDTQV